MGHTYTIKHIVTVHHLGGRNLIEVDVGLSREIFALHILFHQNFRRLLCSCDLFAREHKTLKQEAQPTKTFVPAGPLPT